MDLLKRRKNSLDSDSVLPVEDGTDGRLRSHRRRRDSLLPACWLAEVAGKATAESWDDFLKKKRKARDKRMMARHNFKGWVDYVGCGGVSGASSIIWSGERSGF